LQLTDPRRERSVHAKDISRSKPSRISTVSKPVRGASELPALKLSAVDTVVFIDDFAGPGIRVTISVVIGHDGGRPGGTESVAADRLIRGLKARNHAPTLFVSRSLVVVAALWCAMPLQPPTRRVPSLSGQASKQSEHEIRWQFDAGG
jgi:hypothetical protein